MPRTRRATVGGICYHAITRGNRKAVVFHDDTDYDAFVDLMSAAFARVPCRILAFCLMPNHVHFVLWPSEGDDLSRWMHWLLTTHVRRYHLRYGTDGRVWQGRFKSFPVQRDHHLLTILRYVERNPLRANLVDRAEDWRWSSLRLASDSRKAVPLDVGPVPRITDWTEHVNKPLTESELHAVRVNVNQEIPYGEQAWVAKTADRLGLRASPRGPGRPRSRRSVPSQVEL